MKKLINYRFILTATLTFIPYTVLWFLWHNNIFHNLYYSAAVFYSIDAQNIWAMNFANALFVYGFVYFYYHSVKKENRKINSVLWGIYYNISVIGFFAFMNFGSISGWQGNLLLHELIWSVIGGAIMGVMVYFWHKKIKAGSA